MTRFLPGTRFGALLAAALFACGCDASPKRVEILNAPPSGAKPIRIACSDEAAAPFRRIAGAFGSRKGIRFEIVAVQTAEIAGLLRTGSVDAGVAAGGLPAGMRGAGYVYVPFAGDAIVFVASRDAEVGSLDSARIRKIFRGEISGWGEVGGRRGAIAVVDRPEESIARRVLEKGIFRGDFPEARHGVKMRTEEAAEAAMRERPGFLGYGTLSGVTTGRTPGIALAVDGMPPRFGAGKGKGYPARVEYGLVYARNAPAGLADLADFLLTENGWHELATQGLSPAAKNLSTGECHCRAREGTFEPSGRSQALLGTFTLAVVPELDAIDQENRYAPLAQRIADALGMRSQLVHLRSYRQALEEFSEGRVDAAFVGSLMYGRLHRRMGVVPLVRPESGGVSHYHGLIVVRRGSGLRTLADLEGRRFAFVPDTSAGDLYPRALVDAAGGAWPGYFSALVKAPSHRAAVRLLLSGNVDAAAVKDLVLKREQASSRAAREDLVVLSASDPFPENAFVVAAGIGEEERSRLASMLLSLDREEPGREALRKLGADRMIPAADGDYAAMYSLIRKIRYPMEGRE